MGLRSDLESAKELVQGLGTEHCVKTRRMGCDEAGLQCIIIGDPVRGADQEAAAARRRQASQEKSRRGSQELVESIEHGLHDGELVAKFIGFCGLCGNQLVETTLKHLQFSRLMGLFGLLKEGCWLGQHGAWTEKGPLAMSLNWLEQG